MRMLRKTSILSSLLTSTVRASNSKSIFRSSSSSITPQAPIAPHAPLSNWFFRRTTRFHTRTHPLQASYRGLRRLYISPRSTDRPALQVVPATASVRRPATRRLQGGVNLSALLLAGVIGGTVWYLADYSWTAAEQVDEEERTDVVQTVQEPEAVIWVTMTGEMMTGRPGNLTAEQEAKLREMWIASLRVFGVLDEHDGKEANGTDSAAASIEAPAPEKAKKKKMSIFRRHKDSDTDSAASHEADADDKFGQTKQYHETLAQMSPQEIRNAFWSMVKHDNPDALLLRFLRARKWDVDKALIMMIATMSWRATEMHVDDDVMKRGEEGALLDSRSSNPAAKSLGHDFLEQMKMGKSFLHGTDKLGRPMCVVRARLHKQGEQSEESLERYTVFLIETARMVLAPPVDTACIVFDLTGFSLANMDYSPVKFMIKCFEANYPESLGVVLVHKAPWVFQGIWKIIRGWLDPVVASKVHFTNNVDEMSEFVARKQIPRELGGDEDWSYEYVLPKAGENDVMKDTATRDKLLAGREETVQAYEQATLDWIHLDNGNDATAVKERRNQVAASLRDGYWQLDPYLRAKSLYDRIGMIQPGGKVNFYPTAAPPSAAVNHAATSADDVD